MTGIFDALRKRYAPPAWAYFEEVRNGTGYARKTTRTADGLALSLWPSRGLEMHGIEVKVHRSDWLRELDHPDKAEEIGRFCDRWWLACTPGVVLDLAEVPIAWGLLEWDGKRWKARREATKREAQPLDRLMLASLLRRASESEHQRIDEMARRVAADLNRSEIESAQKQRDALNAQAVAESEKARKLQHLLYRALGLLGLNLDLIYNVPAELPPDVVERLEAARNLDLEQAKREAQRALTQLRSAATTARQALRRAGVRPEPRRRFLYG